jgi:hypothetical protein
MAHGELHVSTHDVAVAQRAPLAYAHAVERPDDGVRQFVLLMRTAREVLDSQLLKAVR